MNYFVFILTIIFNQQTSGLRFISNNRPNSKSQLKQSMCENYDSSPVEFLGSPMDAIPKKPSVEDLICPKLASPIFTATSETADLCLGCKHYLIVRFRILIFLNIFICDDWTN